MSNLIWDNNGCWYGKVSQPTGIIMCSVEIHCKGLDENAVRNKKNKGGISKTTGAPTLYQNIHFFE